MRGTRFKSESWEVRNCAQNASQHHFDCFLKDCWILKSSCSLRSPIHAILRCTRILSPEFGVYNMISSFSGNLDSAPLRFIKLCSTDWLESLMTKKYTRWCNQRPIVYSLWIIKLMNSACNKLNKLRFQSCSVRCEMSCMVMKKCKSAQSHYYFTIPRSTVFVCVHARVCALGVILNVW